MWDSGVSLSLSQIPQALINQDLNTPFDPVIVSLRRTAKLNGKIWFLYSREDYKADATSITLKDSKHICSGEHLHITGVKKFKCFQSNLCISELNNIFTNFLDILIVQNLTLHTLNTHTHTLTHTHTFNLFQRCHKNHHMQMCLMGVHLCTDRAPRA